MFFSWAKVVYNNMLFFFLFLFNFVFGIGYDRLCWQQWIPSILVVRLLIWSLGHAIMAVLGDCYRWIYGPQYQIKEVASHDLISNGNQ